MASLVGAYVAGARDGGMIATIKHFPGHGDTDVDSHLGLPVVTFDRARLQSMELVPFKRGIDAGAEAVMAAHIELPALDPIAVDARHLQPPVLHDLLRAGDGVRRARLHRLDVDGRGRADGSARRGGGARRCWPAPIRCCTRPIRSPRSTA